MWLVNNLVLPQRVKRASIQTTWVPVAVDTVEGITTWTLSRCLVSRIGLCTCCPWGSQGLKGGRW